MSDKLNPEEHNAVEVLRLAELNTDDGMPLELFLLVSSLVPIVNVDLLIVNTAGQLLLSRRNDPYYEKSWHIPGGCMRFNESFNERIERTAMEELGTHVAYDTEPITVRNVIRGERTSLLHPRERGHNVAILYRCTLPEGFDLVTQNLGKTEDDSSYLKWFDTIPEDITAVHHVYDDILHRWRSKNESC